VVAIQNVYQWQCLSLAVRVNDRSCTDIYAVHYKLYIGLHGEVTYLPVQVSVDEGGTGLTDCTRHNQYVQAYNMSTTTVHDVRSTANLYCSAKD